MSNRLIALLAACAVTGGTATVGVAGAVAKGKPRAGQFCAEKKKPPKGFKCKSDKKGKYRLVKG